MTPACPEPTVWLELIAEELPQAQALREHAQGCEHCRAELAQAQELAEALAPPPSPPAASEASVARIMERVRASPSQPVRRPRPPTRLRPWMGAVATALAAGMAFLVLRPPAPPEETGQWTARGNKPQGASLSRTVGVSFHSPSAGVGPLAPGAPLPPEAMLLVRYRSLEAEPVRLMAFAVDAQGEVHWLFPGHVSALTNESSVELPPSAEELHLRDTVVVLEALPLGPLRLFSVVTREPLTVKDIESLPATGRTVEALRQRWPDASVDEVRVEVRPEEAPGP